MMNNFKDFGSDFKMVGTFPHSSNDDSKQRTEEWLKSRSGRFTGSKNSLLMGCGRSTSKLPWGSPEKLYDFGSTAERYIYAVGMERRTGRRSMNISSKQMAHGTEHEPLLIKQLEKDGIVTEFTELGFEQFPGYEFGGASVDGVCMYKGNKVGLELKCCVSWDGHYKRMYNPLSDKHDDFWQFQSELLAVGLDSLLYVVTLPMTVEEYDLSICKASPIHQKALLNRCKIADRAISLWDKHSYKDALLIACAEHKEDNT